MNYSNIKFTLLSLVFSVVSFAQVGIGTNSPSVSLDIVGKPTDATVLDGIIAPRLTGAQLRTKTYTADQTGAQVYVTLADNAPAGQTADVKSTGYYYFDGTKWIVSKGSVGWNLIGNASTDANTNFIGTTDNQDFIVKTNNEERERTFATAQAYVNSSNVIKVISGGDMEINSATVGLGGGNNNTNIALGPAALLGNTKGWGNVAVGLRALVANTIGNTNTAVGVDVLRANTIGGSNSGLGINALYQNTSGNTNTAIGFSSLYSVSKSSYNTGLGAFSGSQTLGSYNTLIGGNAGTYSSGDNNIALGANTEFSNESGSNQMNIGNVIFGTGMNGTVASPAGNIGIGIASPGNKLEIAGTIDTGLKMPFGAGAGKVLQSDASGNGSWVTNIAVTPTIIGNFPTSSIKMSSLGTKYYTGATITVPSGRWIVSTGTSIVVYNGGSGGIGADGQLWCHIYLSSSNTGYTETTDLVPGSAKAGAGAIFRGGLYGTAIGNFLVNNTSATNHTYYLWMDTNNFGLSLIERVSTGFDNGVWERWLYAAPIN